jgi:hypothetical protein
MRDAIPEAYTLICLKTTEIKLKLKLRGGTPFFSLPHSGGSEWPSFKASFPDVAHPRDKLSMHSFGKAKEKVSCPECC